MDTQRFLSGITIICLWALLLFPVAYSFMLTWQEYIRLGVITICLGYLWWKHRSFLIADGKESAIQWGLLAVILIFIANQFDPALNARELTISAGQADTFFGVLGGLTLIAFTAFVFSWNIRRQRPRILDWIIVATVLMAIGLLVGAKFLFMADLPWASSGRYVIYLVLWFIVAHGIPSRAESRKRLWVGIVGVFTLVGLVGCSRIGMAYYHFRAGDKAWRIDNYAQSLEHFKNSQKLSQDLRIEPLYDASLFGQAKILYKQNDPEQVAEILSMEKGFIKKVQLKEWEGPTGGHLYKNISCWKDLKLYEGQVEISVFARGKSAQNIWPRMRVRLGDKTLGEVNVTTQTPQSYSFHTSVKTGTQRLEISFLNDYWRPDGVDRSLFVEEAEIKYKELVWE